MAESRLVYSTEGGDRRRDAAKRREEPQLPDDGVVRIFREKGGRGGRIVTVVRGLGRADLAAVASDLKRHCGTGGSVKEGAVEIQGDHRDKIAARLQSQGYSVKLAGG